MEYENVPLPTGPVDPAKTSFPDHPQWLVVTAGTYHSMTVVPRDAYGNAATIQQDHLTVNIRKVRREGESNFRPCETVFLSAQDSHLHVLT